MLWLGHVLLTRVYFGMWTMWSVAPDIPMILILSPWWYHDKSWREMKNTHLYTIMYKIPHSFFCLFFVPKEYRCVYAFHILCDVLSHTGEWSIQPFFPLPLKVRGVWDPVDWI